MTNPLEDASNIADLKRDALAAGYTVDSYDTQGAWKTYLRAFRTTIYAKGTTEAEAIENALQSANVPGYTKEG